jgi:nucleoside-triphosphatase THEP1
MASGSEELRCAKQYTEKLKMKICVTGVYTEQLKKWCEKMGFEVVPNCSYESNVALHFIMKKW